jgi:hypothetical protein
MPARLVSLRGGIKLGRGLIRPHEPCGRDSLPYRLEHFLRSGEKSGEGNEIGLEEEGGGEGFSKGEQPQPYGRKETICR